MCHAEADSRLLCENVPVTDVLASFGIVAPWGGVVRQFWQKDVGQKNKRGVGVRRGGRRRAVMRPYFCDPCFCRF